MLLLSSHNLFLRPVGGIAHTVFHVKIESVFDVTQLKMNTTSLSNALYLLTSENNIFLNITGSILACMKKPTFWLH